MKEKKIETRTYNNLIIGFGKAGKTLAKFLSGQGETVALIEALSGMYGEPVSTWAAFRQNH